MGQFSYCYYFVPIFVETPRGDINASINVNKRIICYD